MHCRIRSQLIPSLLPVHRAHLQIRLQSVSIIRVDIFKDYTHTFVKSFEIYGKFSPDASDFSSNYKVEQTAHINSWKYSLTDEL